MIISAHKKNTFGQLNMNTILGYIYVLIYILYIIFTPLLIDWFWLGQVVRETPSRLAINKRGVEELFADILYQEDDLQGDIQQSTNQCNQCQKFPLTSTYNLHIIYL